MKTITTISLAALILLAAVFQQYKINHTYQEDLLNELATRSILLEKQLEWKDRECVEKATDIILERNEYRKLFGLLGGV